MYTEEKVQNNEGTEQVQGETPNTGNQAPAAEEQGAAEEKKNDGAYADDEKEEEEDDSLSN